MRNRLVYVSITLLLLIASGGLASAQQPCSSKISVPDIRVDAFASILQYIAENDRAAEHIAQMAIADHSIPATVPDTLLLRLGMFRSDQLCESPHVVILEQPRILGGAEYLIPVLTGNRQGYLRERRFRVGCEGENCRVLEVRPSGSLSAPILVCVED